MRAFYVLNIVLFFSFFLFASVIFSTAWTVFPSGLLLSFLRFASSGLSASCVFFWSFYCLFVSSFFFLACSLQQCLYETERYRQIKVVLFLLLALDNGAFFVFQLSSLWSWATSVKDNMCVFVSAPQNNRRHVPVRLACCLHVSRCCPPFCMGAGPIQTHTHTHTTHKKRRDTCFTAAFRTLKMWWRNWLFF